MLETMSNIFEASHHAVMSMELGDRMKSKELTDIVAAELGADTKHILAFVNHFVHNSDICFVSPGKKGGVIRGVKPVKGAAPLVEPEMDLDSTGTDD